MSELLILNDNCKEVQKWDKAFTGLLTLETQKVMLENRSIFGDGTANGVYFRLLDAIKNADSFPEQDAIRLQGVLAKVSYHGVLVRLSNILRQYLKDELKLTDKDIKNSTFMGNKNSMRKVMLALEKNEHDINLAKEKFKKGE